MFNINQEDGIDYYIFYDLPINDNYDHFIGKTSNKKVTDLLLTALWKKYYNYYDTFQDFKYNSGLNFYIKPVPEDGHLVDGMY